MIYVLLPAFNEADNILALLETLADEARQWYEAQVVSGEENGSPAFEAETIVPVHAIVINDGSTDETRRQADSFTGPIQKTVLNHDTNLGLGAAINTGISFVLDRCSENDFIMTLDADGTHHPRYVFLLSDKLTAGYDIVVASRYAAGGEEIGVGFLRRMLSHGARWLYHLFFPEWPIRDFSCGYRGFRALVLQKTVSHWGERLLEAPGFACTGELILKMLVHTSPDRIAEIPFELHYERKGGKSKMPALRTVWGTLILLLRARGWLSKR